MVPPVASTAMRGSVAPCKEGGAEEVVEVFMATIVSDAPREKKRPHPVFPARVNFAPRPRGHRAKQRSVDTPSMQMPVAEGPAPASSRFAQLCGDVGLAQLRREHLDQTV